MSEHSMSRLWLMRGTFGLISLALIFLRLIPIDTMPRHWAGPDLLVALSFAWVLRRPEYVPALTIGLVILLADLLFLRPPGLMAALIVGAAELLKSRFAHLRDMPFLVEWMNVCTAIFGVTLIYHLTLLILVVERPPLGLSIIHMVMTMLAYPVVVGVSQYLLGVRKPALGEVNALGQRR